MQKTILRKFIKVLILALLLNSAIFYIACSTVLQKTFAENMLYTLKTIDSFLDFSQDLGSQIEKMDGVFQQNDNRITVISRDGTVLWDTEGETGEAMDNHLDRPEIQAAFRDGSGSAERRSQTLQKYCCFTITVRIFR